MENSTSIAVISTLEAEGKALAQEWKAISKADKARFTKATKADGFDTRLGKLMQKLKAEGGERISSDRLKDCGINGIDKRRRSEALWFVENETACREFIQASKKGFTSLTALQAAMRKAAKANTAESSAKANVPTEQVSNVGKSDDPKPTKLVEQSETKVSFGPITRTKMVQTILKQCELNGLDLETIVDDLISAIAKQEKSA